MIRALVYLLYIFSPKSPKKCERERADKKQNFNVSKNVFAESSPQKNLKLADQKVRNSAFREFRNLEIPKMCFW